MTAAKDDLFATVERIAAVQHGVLGRSQLRAAGVSPHVVRHGVERGRLVVMTRKVLRVAGSAPTPRQEAMAAVLDLAPGAGLARSSSLALWGMTDHRVVPVHVLVPRPRRTSLVEPAQVHTSRRIDPSEITAVDGIPVTTPARTVFDMGWVLTAPQLERLLERAWGLQLVDHASMVEVVERNAGRGVLPATRLRPLLAARGPGYRPTDSGLEARVLQILRQAGLSFRHQVVIGGARVIGRMDFVHEHLPAVLEVNSRIFHEGVVDRERDARRRDEATSAGFVVGEVWEDQVWHRPHEVEAEARRILRRACEPVASQRGRHAWNATGS